MAQNETINKGTFLNSKPNPQQAAAMKRVMNALGYHFQEPKLLAQALTHRSFAANNNERLEFVGDAILNYTVARMLFEVFPKLSEGELSRLRANLVNQEVLAQVAREMGLGEALFLGVGELKSGGFNRPSILADAVEAMFAAVCLDADFSAAEAVVKRLFAKRVREVDLKNQGKDAKTLLQETLQAKRLALPKYRIEQQSGEGNEAQFEVSCDLGELAHITYASGSSRREAEQKAAKAALAWLNEQGVK